MVDWAVVQDIHGCLHESGYPIKKLVLKDNSGYGDREHPVKEFI